MRDQHRPKQDLITEVIALRKQVADLREAMTAETRSITRALKACGIEDYSRGSTRISARYATPEEIRSIRLAPGTVMLVTEIVDVDAEDRPIQYALTRFPAYRLELVV